VKRLKLSQSKPFMIDNVDKNAEAHKNQKDVERKNSKDDDTE
jgi:hypothetical protein